MLRVLYILSCYLIISSSAFKCDMKRDKRAVLQGITTWPGNTVPYEIDVVYTPEQQQLIVDSLNEITTKTSNCVNFVPRTAAHTNWVKVVSKTGCWSGVGQSNQPGLQELSLDRSGCMTKDTVIHEFLHALGFNHEQTRPDRDDYIKVLYDNIQPANKYNYDKEPSAALQSVGLPYDFDSIMHYTYNSFTSNGLPAMVTAKDEYKDWRYTMGTGNKLTDSDILKIRKIYGCS